MNAILKTDALVLRIAPFSETSHMVVWLSPAYGKLTTVIKGARRPKSPFLGQYDLFYTCELLFYARERNGTHIARECAPLRTRPALRDHWRAACCASYVCDMLSRITVPGDHQAEIAHLAEAMLDFLCRHPAKPQLVFWFELQLVNTLGLAPQFSRCARCSCPLPQSMAETVFSSPQGGLLCPACSRTFEHGHAPLRPDAVAMLRSWQAASPRQVHNTRCSHQQGLAFRDLLGTFLHYHLDVLPESRRLALNAIATEAHQH